MSDARYYDPELESESPESRLTLRHVARVLKAYSPAIGLAVLTVAVGYTILAIFSYLRAPSERVTTQTFRLEFDGAGSGSYPNGAKFGPSEIVSTEVLLEVFNRNQLGRYMPFEQFGGSVFILQANPEYERLAAEYQARLADRSLTPVDRDRISAEFEAKRESLQKNEYSINFLRRGRPAVPEDLIRKVLNDILVVWARRAVVEQRVTEYRMSVLSPDIMKDPQLSNPNTVIALRVLRSRIERILENIQDLEEAPGATLARTQKERMSLQEIRLRLEEIVRFQVEPLLHRIRRSTSAVNREETIQFLEAQLSYDQRQLKSMRDRAAAIQSALAAYNSAGDITEPLQGDPATRGAAPSSSGTVVPQVSESFLDRIVTMSNRAAEAAYRQKLVDQYKEMSEAAIPIEQDVAADEQLLNEFRTAPGGETNDDAAFRNDVARVLADVRELLRQVNDLHSVLSRNLVPSTQLYTETAVPVTRVTRSAEGTRLFSYGIILVLMTLVVSAIAALLHERATRTESEPEATA